MARVGRVAVLVVAVFFCLGCLAPNPARAYQRAFYGGTFTQADGIYSPQVAVYDDSSKGWQRFQAPDVVVDQGFIWDVYPVGDDGIFATGFFKSVNGKPSFSVAFFDGTKWCPISQGLAFTSDVNNYDQQGAGWAVWCNSATSCYVAGYFSIIENLPTNAPNEVENFAHYIRDNETSSEWVFDTSIIEWNGPALPLGATLPANLAIPGTLVGVPADEPEYFFVAIANSEGDETNPPGGYGSTDGFSMVMRGGKADGGWRQLFSPDVFSGNPRGFYVDASSSSPAIYVVSKNMTKVAMAKKTTVVTRPCSIWSCIFVTGDNEWQSLIPDSADPVIALYDVVAVNSSTRYFIAKYTPGPGFDDRQVVVRQDGFATPVPVGAPFARDTSAELFRVSLHNDEPVVIGNFFTANLEYPTDTDDDGGVAQVDIRELDSVNYIAVFRDGKWTSQFGGGLAPFLDGNSESVSSLVVKHNTKSNKWIVNHPFINFVFNVKAEGLAYFDDDEDLGCKNIMPLFSRRLVSRGSFLKRAPLPSADGGVYDVACEESSCKYVYAGGQFNYHGPDLLGSIAKVEVRRDEPVVMPVGGGLWYTDYNVPDDANLQFTAGAVFVVKSRDGWVYAGGKFSRGKNGYVCLNNIARIRHSDAESGSWEDLGGGCDEMVIAMEFWGDDLYVGGYFKNCGGKQVNYVAAYNNGQFRSLNNGLDNEVYSMEYFQGRIIIAGAFDHAGGLPTGPVAAWDGQSWRALQSACTDDCIPGDLNDYFTVPQRVQIPTFSLHAAKDGTALYALTHGSPTIGYVLAQWKYFDRGDSGQWTIKGNLLSLALNSPYNDNIMNNGTQLVVAGLSISPQHVTSGLGIHAYSLEHENWVDNNVLIGSGVNVVRSSASTLSSFLSFLF